MTRWGKPIKNKRRGQEEIGTPNTLNESKQPTTKTLMEGFKSFLNENRSFSIGNVPEPVPEDVGADAAAPRFLRASADFLEEPAAKLASQIFQHLDAAQSKYYQTAVALMGGDGEGLSRLRSDGPAEQDYMEKAAHAFLMISMQLQNNLMPEFKAALGQYNSKKERGTEEPKYGADPLFQFFEKLKTAEKSYPISTVGSIPARQIGDKLFQVMVSGMATKVYGQEIDRVETEWEASL